MPSASPCLAFATYRADPDFQDDDRLLVHALERRRVTAVPCVWNDPDVDWASFDAIVLRSTWDYFLAPEDFRRWLDARDAEGSCVLNPVAVARWNMDKRYLRDLAARDIDVVPTRWVETGDSTRLAAILREEGWDDVVVKPVISGGAHETWRTSLARAEADAQRAMEVAARGGAMVQPFLPEIADGEWSLLFFGGRFSHAAHKRPTAGEFRVQRQFGGVYSAATAPRVALDAAEGIVTAALQQASLAPAELPYARVDGCLVDGRFLLMELELIEPALFLGQSAEAADRCAEALLEALARATRSGVAAP